MNDPWLECWFETQRIFMRFAWRSRVWWNHRLLNRGERLLGELGWQQAHFDPRDTRFIALQSVEKQEARLVFDIAEAKEKKAECQNLALEKTAALQQALQKARENVARSEGLCLRHIESLRLEQNRQAPIYLIESIEKSIANERIHLQESQSELHDAQQIFNRHLQETQELIQHFQTTLKALEAELHGLKYQKSSHYIRIGQELADGEIAPLNQPEILTRVLRLREKIQQISTRVADSKVVSCQLSWLLRLEAYGLCSLIILAAGSLLFLCTAIFLRIIR